ncbi:hypothetical protein PFISCL1PPCAC_25657 [Pristionchus fissidentatus]|uniref:Uncharacterized protein n=1 Tax=Pristionchus fissidentatus TaxID=1538716 RepID=A0AAV5WUS2_9BILA|nr:hypothetical protein PFISCL1PPCAC_25657 [Pristionchus fissidentatus]
MHRWSSMFEVSSSQRAPSPYSKPTPRVLQESSYRIRGIRRRWRMSKLRENWRTLPPTLEKWSDSLSFSKSWKGFVFVSQMMTHISWFYPT